MRRKWKKLLSTTLALAMVITTIGVREVPVSAAEEENTNESVVYFIWITWHMIPQQDIFIS